MSDQLAVAVVGLVGAVLVALIQASRVRNTREHNTNSDKLDTVVASTTRIEQRLDHHIDNHHAGRP